MILAGDIGGTKVNFGLYEIPNGHLNRTRDGTFPSKRYARLQDMVKEFLAGAGNPKIERACFGIAGPVRNGQVHLTNLPWEVKSADLASELNIGTVSLINDLEANGYGLAELPPSDFCVLNAGDATAKGNGAIISAGTGLGEAGLYWDGAKFHPFACEGGHTDFAPLTPLDAELFDYLEGRFGRVSFERVLSGAGLYNIYQFLRDTRRGEEPANFADALSKNDPAAVISAAAANNESSRCVQAVDLFVSYYGAEAGNLALKMMATGGVFLGGGIAPKMLPRLQRGDFLKAFLNKAPMQLLMQTMPVRVILNPGTALLGAAHYAAFGTRSITTPS